MGPHKFDENDAKQWADWGIDYLKYDWRIEVPSTIRMQQALLKSGRDIHFSISNSAPFANASDWAKLTNSFRTGPDIRDSWTSCTSLHLCWTNGHPTAVTVTGLIQT